MSVSYLKRILDARIYDLAIETPLETMRLMSSRLENHVLLKREDLQPVFSFKIRGAYNKLLQIAGYSKKPGVITASAGNHAQGLAMAARHLGMRATIVMPETTPTIKVETVRRLSGRIVLRGDTYDEAAAEAMKRARTEKLVFVSPYDDPDVIAGQGTVAMEILRQHSGKIDAVFIPVGGGGLCAGMTEYIRSMRSKIKIFAVEPEDAACLKAAIAKDRRVVLPQVGIFTDGVAVRQVGKEPFRLLRSRLDGVITVNTDETCAAIKDIFEDTRSIAEPAGALALAGLKKYVDRIGCREKTLVAINSGANMNFDRLSYIAERTEIGEKREAIFAVTIPEEAGSYRKFCNVLGKRPISEFNYRYADDREAHIFVGLKMTPGRDAREGIIRLLSRKGYKVVDMTDNEMAKMHIRHMVGGRVTGVKNEVIYRFEFPERPGALLKFLNKLAGRWSISMFHYRNHGAAFGRVLAGLQVPPGERRQFEAMLKELHYNYWNETRNPAYTYFLG